MALPFSPVISNRIPAASPRRAPAVRKNSSHAKTGTSKTREISILPLRSNRLAGLTVVEQPRAVAYKPVHDLSAKITILAAWLIVRTAIIAWLAGKFYRRQSEAAARIEREVIFNEKILANMPSGIALVDPESRHFLQANEAFAKWRSASGTAGRKGN